MWDNRGRKKHPNEPDFRCKNKAACAGKIEALVVPPQAAPPQHWAQTGYAPQQAAPLPRTDPYAVGGSPIEAEYLSLVERVGARLLSVSKANGWPPVLMADIQSVSATIYIQQRKAGQ